MGVYVNFGEKPKEIENYQFKDPISSRLSLIVTPEEASKMELSGKSVYIRFELPQGISEANIILELQKMDANYYPEIPI